MGIGTALAFIAVGAILAFAFHFHVSGIDIQMIGWILIFVGVAMLLITLLYLRPRRRRPVVSVPGDQPGAYVGQIDDAAVVEGPVDSPAGVERQYVDPADPMREPVRGHRRDLPPR